MKLKIDRHTLDEIWRNPENWRGLIYFNKKDPRILVPKSNPLMGWTFNFARPLAYILIIGIALIIILIALFFGNKHPNIRF